MTLKVLGKYGPYPKECCCTSSYLLLGRGAIVFEMGSGSFSRLISNHSPEDVSAVVISHFHQDHIADLGVYNYYLESISIKRGERVAVKLYLPDCDCPEKSIIKNFKYFDPIFVKECESINIGQYRMQFFKTRHPVYCLGFVLNDGDKKFMYSADTNYFYELDDIYKKCDFALLDGAFLKKDYSEAKPHMSVDLCSNLASKYSVKTIITHIHPANNEEDCLKEINSEFAALAEENKSYTLW